MKKLAFVTSGYLPIPPTKGGAVENLVYNLVKENSKFNKLDITVYSIEDSSVKEDTIASSIYYITVSKIAKFCDKILYFLAKNILRSKHIISYRYFFQRMSFFKEVAKELHRKDFDFVVLENNVVMFKVFKYYHNQEKYKDKVIYHAHNELGISLGYQKWLKNCFVICVSQFICNSFIKRYDLKPSQCRVLPNTVDSSLFLKNISAYERVKLKKDLNLKPCPVILFAGRLSPEKGIMELVHSLQKVNYPFNLLIVGSPFYDTGIKSTFLKELKAECNKLGDSVIFTGFVDYQEMYKYYQICDFCVLPSTWNEPASLTIIECIMSGAPLISTKVGGTPEYVSENTLMLTTEDLEKQLYNTIDELLAAPYHLAKLKKISQKDRTRFHSLDDYYDSFLKLIACFSKIIID